VLSVTNARVNTSECLTNDRCPVGTLLEYVCSEGYIISSPTTACLDNSSWSHQPECIEQKGTLISNILGVNVGLFNILPFYNFKLNFANQKEMAYYCDWTEKSVFVPCLSAGQFSRYSNHKTSRVDHGNKAYTKTTLLSTSGKNLFCKCNCSKFLKKGSLVLWYSYYRFKVMLKTTSDLWDIIMRIIIFYPSYSRPNGLDSVSYLWNAVCRRRCRGPRVRHCKVIMVYYSALYLRYMIVCHWLW